jgi:ribosomal protein L11 methyltransferase
VLSIAAAKLGFAPVLGVDLDDAAVEAARANAAANGVGIEARRADALADELPVTDVVLANVQLEVVERLLPRLRAPLAVTSGYLDRDRPAVDGWEPLDRREADGWAADLLRLGGR